MKTTQEAIDDIVDVLKGLDFPDWSTKQKLAVGCRILAKNGHGSGLAGQFTVRGDAPDTMWTLPYGMGFEEATASDFLLVDNDLNVLLGDGAPNMANRFHLHVYRARADIQSMVHTHPPATSALSMIGVPLHPSHMDTSMFYDDVAHLAHWPGVPFGDDEGQLITDAIGDKNAILLAHHGQLCAGPSIEAACVMAIFFERAADLQLRAMAAGDIQNLRPDLGKEAHDWRHKPEAMKVTFQYFARMALRDDSDAVFK